jgi:predicted HD phosphohydrolase
MGQEYFSAAGFVLHRRGKSMNAQAPTSARFRAAVEATREDWDLIEQAEQRWRRDVGAGAGLLRLLGSLQYDDALGAPVNLYTHCLQTATRALQDGADDELVVVALFHDVPEAISENDHGVVAAQLLAPRISAARSWLLTHHGAFQNYYFPNHPTRDRNARDEYWTHPYAAQTDYFCRYYDQNSFDPDFPALPLDAFRPIVRRFFAATASAA